MDAVILLPGSIHCSKLYDDRNIGLSFIRESNIQEHKIVNMNDILWKLLLRYSIRDIS